MRADARLAAAPRWFPGRSAQKRFGNTSLVSSSVYRIPSAKHEDPAPSSWFTAVEDSRKSARAIEGEKASQGQDLRSRKSYAAKRIAQGNRSLPEGSSWRVEPDRVKSVAKEEMLPAVSPDDPLKVSKPMRVETIRNGSAEDRVNRQDKWMSIGAPEGPSAGHPKLGRFEHDEAKVRCNSLPFSSTNRGARGRAIYSISPQPLPGDQRAVCLKELRVRRPVAPIRIEFASGSHT